MEDAGWGGGEAQPASEMDMPVTPPRGQAHLPPSFLDTFQSFQQITVFANWLSGAQERCYL
jgi:hypothetical protein